MRHALGTRAFFTFGAGLAVALVVDAYVGLGPPLLAVAAAAFGALLFAASFRLPQRNVTAGD